MKCVPWVSELFSTSARLDVKTQPQILKKIIFLALGGHLQHAFAALSIFTSVCNLVVCLVGWFGALINRCSYFTITTLKSLNIQKGTCKLKFFEKKYTMASQLITYVSFIDDGYKQELRKILLILKQLYQSDKSCHKISYFSPTMKKI